VGSASIGSKNHEYVRAGDAGAGDHDGQEREVANLVGEALGGETEWVEASQIRRSGPEGPERLVRNKRPDRRPFADREPGRAASSALLAEGARQPM
jgi:hypothetical protein